MYGEKTEHDKDAIEKSKILSISLKFVFSQKVTASFICDLFR
jgi:hypothetical protein